MVFLQLYTFLPAFCDGRRDVKGMGTSIQLQHKDKVLKSSRCKYFGYEKLELSHSANMDAAFGSWLTLS
jgi:hypothetical protein